MVIIFALLGKRPRILYKSEPDVTTVDAQFVETDIKEGVEPTDAERTETAMYDNMAMEGEWWHDLAMKATLYYAH